MMTALMNQSEEQIQKFFTDSDIKRWKEEIEIINLEMVFYRNLLQDHLKEYAARAEINYEALFQGIADVQYYNQIFQESFLSFKNKLFALAECQDLQCENYFLVEHAKLKEAIERHFSTYKQFKKTLFNHLKIR